MSDESVKSVETPDARNDHLEGGLRLCPFCGRENATTTRKCPRCDYRFDEVYEAKPAKRRGTWAIWFFVVIILIDIIGVFIVPHIAQWFND